MYELRDYQKELIDKIFTAWAEGDRRVMAQLSTGAGKSVIVAHIARSFLEQGEGVLAIAHREELILQLREKLEAVSGLECGVVKANYPNEPHKDIQVASIQSLSRRKYRPDAGLVIIDEAHLSAANTYSKIIEEYKDAYILGVTATPTRADGQGFKWLFDELVCGISARELIKIGHLCQFKLFAANPISTKGIKKTGGEFNQAQLEDRAMSVIGDVVPTWEKYALGKQTLVFAVSIAHSKQMVKLYNDAGYIAEHIDGTTPDEERKNIIQRFRDRKTMILSNCSILTTGFDYPGIEVVQCVRPTMSLSLHLQILGRGLRPSPESGKKYCIIIDHSDNWREHGLPDEEREWSLEPISLKPTRFTQQCPECCHVFCPLSHEQSKPIKKFLDDKGMVRSIHLSKCPSCLHQFQWEQGEGTGEGFDRVAKRDHGEVIEINIDCSQEGIDLIRQTIAIQESTDKKKGWIYFQIMRHELAPKLSLGDWRYLAKHLGYKEGWAYKAWLEGQAVQLQLPI